MLFWKTWIKCNRIGSHTEQNKTLADKAFTSTMSSLIKMESQVDECIDLVETRFRELAR